MSQVKNTTHEELSLPVAKIHKGLFKINFMMDTILKKNHPELTSELFEICREVCRQLVDQGVDPGLARLAKMLAYASCEASILNEEVEMEQIHEMNCLLSKLMKDAPSDKMKTLVNIQNYFGEIFRQMREPNLLSMWQIALQICCIIDRKGRGKLEELLSIYQNTFVAFLKTPQQWYRRDINWLCSIIGWIFRSLHPYLVLGTGFEENIVVLLGEVVELLPRNGDVDMPEIFRLNKLMWEILESGFDPASAETLSSLFKANERLSSLMVVYPDRAALQAGLLRVTVSLIEHLEGLFSKTQDARLAHLLKLMALTTRLTISSFDGISKVSEPWNMQNCEVIQRCLAASFLPKKVDDDQGDSARTRGLEFCYKEGMSPEYYCSSRSESPEKRTCQDENDPALNSSPSKEDRTTLWIQPQVLEQALQQVIGDPITNPKPAEANSPPTELNETKLSSTSLASTCDLAVDAHTDIHNKKKTTSVREGSEGTEAKENGYLNPQRGPSRECRKSMFRVQSYFQDLVRVKEEDAPQVEEWSVEPNSSPPPPPSSPAASPRGEPEGAPSKGSGKTRSKIPRLTPPVQEEEKKGPGKAAQSQSPAGKRPLKRSLVQGNKTAPRTTGSAPREEWKQAKQQNRKSSRQFVGRRFGRREDPQEKEDTK